MYNFSFDMSNKKSKPTVTFEVPSKAPDGNILLIKILLQMKIDSIKLQTRVRHHEDSRTKSIPIQLSFTNEVSE